MSYLQDHLKYKDELLQMTEFIFENTSNNIYYINFYLNRFSLSRIGKLISFPYKWRIKHNRFHIIQEPDDDRLHVGILKQFTGNDMIYARELNSI